MNGMKIMLVDDEKRLLLTTEKLFNKLGIEIVSASNGIEALEKLQSTPVHVVFLDIKMPEMDGMQTLAEIKKNHPLIEVIILTGHASMESAVEGLRLGAMDYLIKPVSMKDLLSKAEEAFEKYKRQEAKIRSAQTGTITTPDTANSHEEGTGG